MVSLFHLWEGRGVKTKDGNFHFFVTPFLSQDLHVFASPVGLSQSVPSPNVVRLWAMVLLIGGECGQEDQKWQIIQTGLQTADFYVIKMCQN